MAKNNQSDNTTNIVNSLSNTLKEVLDTQEGISKEDLKKLKDKGQAVLNQAKDYLKENGSQLVDKAKQAAVTTQDYAEKNPWKIAAITAITTYVINTLLSRKK